MIEKEFKKVNEKIYIDKLNNGIDVYLYPTNKTKNFYMTISVKYGANVEKYKLNNKIYNVIPGSAHFLEHKVMALSENIEISKRINDLGSIANAWTSYYGTNYNIFGSINPKENLKLLLDIFYNTDINPKNVEEEKGIIGEEVDLYKDELDYFLRMKILKNMFNNSYVKNDIVGERTDLIEITSKSLNEIYNNYYISNNTFITIVGNFDKEEIMNTINEYMDKLKLKEKELPKRIIEKEEEKVSCSYEEISKDTDNIRVFYGIKIKKDKFGIKDDNLLKDYLEIIMSCNFSPTSSLYEKYKNNNIVNTLGYSVLIIDDYLIIVINAQCKDSNIFLDNIKEDINNLTITEIDFNRKKKYYLKNYITSFENIEDIEYLIATSLMIDNKIDYEEYDRLNNINYKDTLKILKLIDNKNISILKTIKENK